MTRKTEGSPSSPNSRRRRRSPPASAAHAPGPIPLPAAGTAPSIDTLLSKLLMAPGDPGLAEAWARMAYVEWLAGLPGRVSYADAALEAFEAARSTADISPATAAFRRLLARSAQLPPAPLDLGLPKPARRGGARARRLSI
ncbi:MAG: hypothetical protein AAFU80_04640 [Pseudomonadota bacterium]